MATAVFLADLDRGARSLTQGGIGIPSTGGAPIAIAIDPMHARDGDTIALLLDELEAQIINDKRLLSSLRAEG